MLEVCKWVKTVGGVAKIGPVFMCVNVLAHATVSL